MKINYALVSRSLIALLFVVAGIQKIMGFVYVSQFIGSLGIPLPVLVTILVIIIEVPVALAFAYGYKICTTGYILIGFVALATILVHRNIELGDNMIMVLKNIAIIGGILAIIKSCNCKSCVKCHEKECQCGICEKCKANK